MVFNSIIKFNLAGFCGRSKPLPYAFNKYVIPEKFRPTVYLTAKYAKKSIFLLTKLYNTDKILFAAY